ncbi:MAG: hypothetical protein AAF202_12210, partial [Pseudomonadota bacterium]
MIPLFEGSNSAQITKRKQGACAFEKPLQKSSSRAEPLWKSSSGLDLPSWYLIPMANLQDSLKECEALIREGQLDIARAMLNGIFKKNIPSSKKLPFAKLCRRVGLNRIGLMTLTPKRSVDRDQWVQMATADEIAEYALLIQRMGLVQESLKLL